MTDAYARPEALVDTDWVLEHAGDPDLRLIEVDVDASAYLQGHIPGAIGFNWQTQLQDTVRRDILGFDQIERLLGEAGLTNRMRVVLYGDNSNWFAAYGFWLMSLYGHKRLALMDGGRQKWIEEGRPLTREIPRHPRKLYQAALPDPGIRAMRGYVESNLGRYRGTLVDVRSYDEFIGRILAPPGLSETAQRGGHIPGAKNIPWSQAVRIDGTFKTVDELKLLYAVQGITPDKEVITYCRIGERSSHSWYVLKYLLGFPNVLNYDGSWTEWGSMIGAPVEK